jgi:hypothetical protein
MASKKEKERDDRETRQNINIALDETKSSVNKTTQEAMKEIPQYTKAINDYQEETIQATKDIADNFLESQKEVINSMESVWITYFENMQNLYWSYWTPRRTTENYTRAVSNITDSSIAATRLANNYFFASMEAWKTTVRHARDNAIEYSRLNANYAKTFQNTSIDNLRDYQARMYEKETTN